MSKHTPGPWEAKRWNDDDAGIYGWSFSAGGYLLPLMDVETDDAEICDANARLIAAAPDLLDVLEMIGNVPCPEDVYKWLSDSGIIKARAAAIAKATGND